MIVIENAKKKMIPLEEKEIEYLDGLAKRAYSAAVYAHANGRSDMAVQGAMIRYVRIGQGIQALIGSKSIFESTKLEDPTLHRLCLNYAIGYTASAIAACPIKNKGEKNPTLKDLEKAVEEGDYKKIMETTSYMANREKFGDILQILGLVNIKDTE